ncbi:tRNA (adenosine(37)-N6)-dimethylallyltransferase MiaA [Candidatus Woesebacteria bacterium]|nr:tRNA (adenosine(37)-N6)-dimethylallyltransferase MiaA [Candidatus Woesebacteria bacterium]
MQKLLVICGPTATGKTGLALALAKSLGGEIISADSRQVYQKMDIGTGKDLPRNAKKIGGYYLINAVPVWGYDLVDPKENFSVANYVHFARKTINEVARRKLPILVGGTGLYIQGVVDGIPTAFVPKNQALRKNLIGKSPSELFEILAQQDPIKAASLNASDKKNPRRLIRAVEIAQWKLKTPGGFSQTPTPTDYSTLFIGLTAPKEYLFKKIDRRVEARVDVGIEKEIKKLIAAGISWDDQAMSSLGYRQWRGFFEGTKNKNETISAWKKEEKKYAKRQITWFKRDRRIKWFDVSKPHWSDNLEKLAKKWYSSENAKKN